ncbi:MAG: hypothetical protein HOL17_14855 [Gammaproteobacteria bacterium]|jgi:hypothetical protein|nr:hypothetical protein [Gammaproteobacteria bacterium]MBT4605388.1 hypothetical protein [Thiotrichales bacterium]MBT7684815.1 hypothetical protein [Candidatus Neomarinimicrobiota bacterium]MBT5372977.1 hypothetical protein [Gammaproteobacteria bacterium]MBT5747077.1 hypothetical protein [Gammaproteobacteria bacterium]
MSTQDLATALSTTNAILKAANREELEEALRIASLIIAEHDRLHGSIALERIYAAMHTDKVDEETERMLITGFEYLAGILGNAMQIQAGSGDEVVH